MIARCSYQSLKATHQPLQRRYTTEIWTPHLAAANLISLPTSLPVPDLPAFKILFPSLNYSVIPIPKLSINIAFHSLFSSSFLQTDLSLPTCFAPSFPLTSASPNKCSGPNHPDTRDTGAANRLLFRATRLFYCRKLLDLETSRCHTNT